MRRTLLILILGAIGGCASAPPPPPPVELTADAFAPAHRLARRGDVPKMVARKEPYVPSELQGVASDVTLELLVDRNGVVLGSRQTAGDARFYPAVATAAQQWRFEPLLVDGQPAAFTLPVQFVLTWPAPRRANIVMSYVIPE